ncbi:MAG TPA: beta-ketoacyl synthase N-terminal-like domain-containing protein [Anaerolineales bacterium]|nr:beta-ketoacyl synthase N-terminal-like domain-containing protein [Anaerolineales bacterium]
MNSNQYGHLDAIALIGAGCTLPGKITDPQSLLAALREGRDLITEIPPDRWSMDAYYDPDALAPGKTYVRKGSFIEDVYNFDPGFFGITDAEAVRIDPQQRMLLQTIWHALEDAGQSAEELMNSNTGVFLAMMNTNNYSHLKGVFEGPMGINAYDAMGDAMSIAAGRISHFLGLEGPCLTLDTACSSSLVALHLARQSILAGDCDMAIVAGVNIILHPAVHIAFSKLGLMSRAGRCATFDASADGYIRGEGCVAVVLRRQTDAIARGDRIIASIVGTAVNQDGRTPALTAPNGRSQEKVIRNALARTAINPNEISYVEAHGTGTPVGDPIEMSAIVNVYGPGRAVDRPLYVGSVKSNFGHIEAGAGLLGLVKSALSLQHEEIFPSIHFKKLNPAIDLGQAPVHVATERIPWPRSEAPRLAGINSFGYSGTNAHVILQEAPLQQHPAAEKAERGRSLFDRAGELVVISSKSPTSLDELSDQWLEFLSNENTEALRNIAFTSALSRTQLTQRLAVIGKDKEDIRQKLQTWRDGRTPKGLAHGQIFAKIKPRIAFMFTGQGSQYAEMGRELYESEPRFADAINRIASIMDPELGAPLLEVLFGERSAEYLENTRYVQPALFAIEYALADLLRYWGVEPSYVIGHSIGEIVAACVAGMLDVEDAARFVVVRGRLMGSLPEGGTMLAIAATPEQVQRWIQGKEAEVAIATVNGPHAVVISGRAEAVAEVGEMAQTAGRQVKELEVSHAFHSPLMDPILAELTQAASAMRISTPRIPILSNTSGDFFGNNIQPDYWSGQVRNAVLFHQGMQKVMDAGCSLIVEIGPHPALTPMVITAFDTQSLQTTPTLRKDKKDASNLLSAISTLFVNGAPLKFERLFGDSNYERVALPLYPFHREKYSLGLEGVLELGPDSFPLVEQPEELPELPELHPLLGRVVSRNSQKVVFETALKTTSPWTDHRVLDSTIFPGAGYVEMAARGFATINGQSWQAAVVKDMSFEQPLLLSYREEKKVTLTLEQTANGKGDTKFVIAAGDGSLTYCRGRITLSKAKQEQVQIEAELSSRESEMKVGVFYGELRSRGLEYGARFANVRELWLGQAGSGEAFGRVLNAATGNGRDPFNNAVVLDGCLQVFGAALATLDGMTQPGAYVPASVQAISFADDLPEQVWSHVKISADANGRGVLATIRVLDETGRVLAKFENMELRRIMSLSFGRNNGSAKRTSGNQIFKSRAHAVELLRPLARKERVALLSKWLIAEIKDTIGQAADGLNLEKLPPNTAFLEIGLDSLLVTELQRRIQEKLEFRFKPMQGLDYQSIETMAEFLHDEALAVDLQGETAAQAIS